MKKNKTKKQPKIENEEALRVGQAIRRIRRERKMKQAELAALVQMQPAQLCNSEKGNNLPSLKTLGRICKALGVTVNDLLYPRSELAAQSAEAGAAGAGTPVGDGAGIPATLSPDERLYEPLSARGILRCTQTAEQDAAIDERVVAMLLQRILDHLALETMCGVNKHATIPLNVSFNVDANGAEQLASLVRMHFGIVSAVAFDYVELLENNGLRVIFSQLPAPLESLSFFDAKNNNAFIVVSDAMTPERQLFKIMYELANIFLYTRTGNALVYDTDGTRHFAKRFAAVMLMPQTAVQTSVARAGILPEQWTFEMLLRMKARFGVSAEAFLYRLDELSLLPRDGALLESLSKAIKQHYLKTSFKEPAGEVSRMSRNVRFTDLLLCAKLTPENGKEVRKIESRVRKNYPLDESIPVVKASAKNVDKKRSGPVRPKRAK